MAILPANTESTDDQIKTTTETPEYETVGQKIDRITKAKKDIKEALKVKGAEIEENTKFEDFPQKLDALNVESIGKYFWLVDDGKSLTSPLGVVKEFPFFDTSGVKDFTAMFKDCENMITAPALDTSNGTKFYGMFAGCKSLTTLNTVFPEDQSHGEAAPWTFNNGPVDFTDCPLGVASIKHVIKHLGSTENAEMGISDATKNNLGDEYEALKAEALKKGWTIGTLADFSA